MRYFFTVDIGGTDMKYGVINENAELVFKSITPTNGHLGGKNVTKQISDLFKELSKEYKLEGIAISSTGVIDETTQILTPSISIINYEEVNFRKELAHLNVPVSAENDVNSMALCEKDLVINSDKMKCVIAMTVGTGIGGAIFIDNNLHKGFLFTAGEWGKMKIGHNTYEGLASTSSLVAAANEIYPELDNGVNVFKLYDSGNEEIIKIVDTFYDNLATGLANIIYVLNPDHIVLGGGITNRGERFLNELKAKLTPKLWDYFGDKFKITLAKTKNDAGMIGAFKNFKLTFK
ncbi:ROK family protein [Haploplasma axanthum]|uniref:ROK family sugar kinase n=1 Tax=Haploplasma axanthum TaxID=29552 RepID=A0A449BFE0_HAPAX|nr:ROK family protein [Haploplasma axanthum]VEU81156.1 ROK family sugar kinase [Haploplasma axanthum]